MGTKRTRLLVSLCRPKMLTLPRQARDTHKEKLNKTDGVLCREASWAWGTERDQAREEEDEGAVVGAAAAGQNRVAPRGCGAVAWSHNDK